MSMNDDVVIFRLPLHMKIRIRDYCKLNSIKVSHAMRIFCDEYFKTLTSERTK
jgi:hypothetical protein